MSHPLRLCSVNQLRILLCAFDTASCVPKDANPLMLKSEQLLFKLGATGIEAGVH
jgi:hypothetical protein